jgi:hypothetical protein
LENFLVTAFSVYPVKREYCENPKEQPSNNIDRVMKHAVDGGNSQEEKSQPVKRFHPFKMSTPPPRCKQHSCNVGAWKSCARIFSLGVNKISYSPKQASVMKIFISQSDRSLNRQEYVDDITEVEQGGKLKNEALEELYIFAE